MNDQASTPNAEPAGYLIPAARNVPTIREPYGPLSGYSYGAEASDESEQFLLKLLRYWAILYKHKWLILFIAASITALGAVRTLMQTPLYTSTVRVQIDRAGLKVVEGGSDVVSSDDYGFMQTQFQLLKSRAMAERVVSLLKLSHDAVGRVLGGLSVDQVALSRLVDLTYTGVDPSETQKIANAYADAFMAMNIDKRFQANESAKLFLEDKIKQLKQKLEDSENNLVEFAQKQQIVATEQKQSTAEANLTSASAELQALITERTKNEELWRQTQNMSGINLPQLLSNKVIEELRAARNGLELEYQEKLQTYKPSYPAMVQIQNKIKEIDRQLAAEVNTINSSLKAAYESSLAQEKTTAARVAVLKREVLDLQKRSIQYNILKREVDTNRDLYTSLLQRFKEVDVASGVASNNVFVVDRAMPGVTYSRGLVSAIFKSLVLGLAAGLDEAYGLEFLDNKLRTAEQVEQVTGLPMLGVIPNSKNVSEELADPRSPLSEAYRSLCTSLQFTTETGIPRTLTLTSAGPAEGKSLTSLAIARHFARMGRKVLLVDADLRNPSLHEKLGCDNSVGLSNYLTGGCTPPQVMQKTDIGKLAFIASGPLPPNAADVLTNARLVSLLSLGSEVFDLIILDGPPVLGLADALLLSSTATGTIFVVAAGQSRTTHVRSALKRLQRARGTMIGAVLAKYDAKTAGYGYDYGYGYGYGYGDGYQYGTDSNPRGLSVRKSDQQLQQLTDTHESA